jgi:hypothetical protein
MAAVVMDETGVTPAGGATGVMAVTVAGDAMVVDVIRKGLVTASALKVKVEEAVTTVPRLNTSRGTGGLPGCRAQALAGNRDVP